MLPLDAHAPEADTKVHVQSVVTHYTERILELHLLGSPTVAAEREDIELHLGECRNCAELYAEMKEFYGAVNEGREIRHLADQSTVALRIRPQVHSDVQPMGASDRFPALSRLWRNPRTRISAGMASIAALALIVVMMRPGAGAQNAHHATIDDPSHSAVIHNADGDFLFRIALHPVLEVSMYTLSGPNRQILFADIDGDQESEVITTLAEQVDDQWKTNILRVFRSDGSLLWRREIGEAFSFRGEPYSNHFSLRGIVAGDFDNDGRKEIVVGGAHYHSPYFLYRYEYDGTLLGSYRTFGHGFALHATDLEYDGRQEILLGGQLDVNYRDRRAFLVALDPSRIVGVSEASFSEGFGVAVSQAEKFALRFPRTGIDSLADYSRQRVTGITMDSEAEIRFPVESVVKGVQMSWDYSISRDFVPLQVRETDAVRNGYAELQKLVGDKLVTLKPSSEGMIRAVECWTGSAWRRMDERLSSGTSGRPPMLGGSFARSFMNPVAFAFDGQQFRFLLLRTRR